MPERVRAQSLDGLPVTGTLKTVTWLSWVIATLSAIAAIIALLFPTAIYVTDELITVTLPVDIFRLAVGLPVLLASMRFSRRGSLVGLLCWPGVLLFMLYDAMALLVGVPFGPLFAVYLLLVPLTAGTLITLFAAIDRRVLKDRFEGRVPRRMAGWILVSFTSLFILWAISDIVTALQQGLIPSLQTLIADYTTIAPVTLIGGVLLLRRKPFGYAAAIGLLLAYALLFFGVIPPMIYQSIHTGSPLSVVGLLMMIGMGAIALGALLLYARAVRS